MRKSLFGYVAALAAVSALVGCSKLSPSSSPGVAPSPVAGGASTSAPGGTLSLRASEWGSISTPQGFPLQNDAGGNLTFTFPGQGSINYVFHGNPPKVLAGTLSVSLQVTASGPVLFDYVTEPTNTCQVPASVRPFLWANGNGDGEFDRWWSTPVAHTLGVDASTLSVPLTPDHWSSVFGKMGNADAAAEAGFNKALQNVTRLGLTFGGGCFFGHGVTVRGGTAAFTLLGYQVG
jgi:hypothetical protein